MDFTLESREGVLWVTVTGPVSLNQAIELFITACDTAVEGGLVDILVDFSAAKGNLSTLERYELGRRMANYYLMKRLLFKVATVGDPPLIDGFAAKVASNRGVHAVTFRDTTDAVEWLNSSSHNVSRHEDCPSSRY